MTVYNIPEEVLSLIFEKLPESDLCTCQRVCHFWYSPARTLLLNHVRLYKDNSKIQKFISSIDCNPDRKYLNAVKQISINMPDSISVSKNDVYKLLFRFPNLTAVRIFKWISFLQECSDEMCEDILVKCPDLNHFEVIYYGSGDDDQFYDWLYNVRLLVTFVDLNGFLQQGDVVEYLASFPRLQKVKGTGSDLNEIEQVLQLMQQLPNLSDIAIDVEIQEDHFMERFLAPLTSNERELIINRLSNVNKFDITCPIGFCVNSTNFLVKYLTGIEEFKIWIECPGESLTDQQQQILCDNITDLIRRAKSSSEVYFDTIRLSDWPRYLPIIQNKAVFSSATTFRMKLLDTSDGPTPAWADMWISSRPLQKSINVRASEQLTFPEITSTLLADVPVMNNVDALVVELYKNYEQVTNITMYNEIFDKLPMLKKVTLTIPQSYQDCEDNGQTYPLVEELRLHVHPNVEFGSLFERFNLTFPNMKHLDLFDFRSNWKEESKEVCVDLSSFSLQRLTVDFAPFLKKFPACLGKDVNFKEQKFCIVELILANNGEKRLYKLKLRQLSAKLIDENDLIGHDDYVRVKITVGSLQRFDIYYAQFIYFTGVDLIKYQHRDDDGFFEYRVYPVPHVTLFNSNW